jgi:hypothetical protein
MTDLEHLKKPWKAVFDRKSDEWDIHAQDDEDFAPWVVATVQSFLPGDKNGERTAQTICEEHNAMLAASKPSSEPTATPEPAEKPQPTPEEHWQRHPELLRMLDELVADWVTKNARRRDEGSIRELQQWAKAQSKKPTTLHHCSCSAPCCRQYSSK